MIQGTRSAILKLMVIITIIIAVDQTLRKRVLLSPGEVVEKYMVKVGLHIKGGLTAKFPERVSQLCADLRQEEKQKLDEDFYFLIKSKSNGGKSLLLCIPPRMATKQAFEYVSSLYGGACPGGRLRGCAVGTDWEPDNNTVTAVMVRHPFDRLIIEYKHHKHDHGERGDSYSNVPGRQVLFSRHRAAHDRKKNKRDFREFINNWVLSDNSSVKSVTQICNVCSRHYDISIKLDEGQEKFIDLMKLLGNSYDENKSNISKQKTFAQKLQRKYFSEITAEEMENLVRKFNSDFLIFGYTFEKYKKALKNN